MLQLPHVQPRFLQAWPCGQALPQAPQFAASVPTATSQPSAGLPLQSKKALLQAVMAQPALMHCTTALGLPAQGMPQAPQFLASVSTDVSQPVSGLPSQS